MSRTPLLVALSLAVLVACETVEEAPPEPVIVPMSEAEFSSALQSAKAATNPYSGERELSVLVDSPTVSPDQRSRALYARGTQRWKKTNDKAGAKSDFDEYVELYPAAAFTNNARLESGYVQAEIRAAQARLQTLQTLRDWFDDTWALGKKEEAVSRYRRSGLTPEPHQVYKLRSTGFLCEGMGNSKLHNYGPLTSEIQNLFWCK